MLQLISQGLLASTKRLILIELTGNDYSINLLNIHQVREWICNMQSSSHQLDIMRLEFLIASLRNPLRRKLKGNPFPIDLQFQIYLMHSNESEGEGQQPINVNLQ